MRRWRMPVISRHGISGWPACVAIETLPAASPITSSARIAAFWCNRLVRNAAWLSPSTKLCASRAASSISSRSAASRSGGLAINRLGLPQNAATTNEIAAGFDRFALDEVHRATEKFLQRVLEIGKSRQVVPGSGRERDEEIGVAMRGLEAGAACRGTENLQPRDAVPAAECGDGVALFGDVSVHGLHVARG